MSRRESAGGGRAPEPRRAEAALRPVAAKRSLGRAAEGHLNYTNDFANYLFISYTFISLIYVELLR